jgi:hypothetical protein
MLRRDWGAGSLEPRNPAPISRPPIQPAITFLAEVLAGGAWALLPVRRGDLLFFGSASLIDNFCG